MSWPKEWDDEDRKAMRATDDDADYALEILSDMSDEPKIDKTELILQWIKKIRFEGWLAGRKAPPRADQ